MLKIYIYNNYRIFSSISIILTKKSEEKVKLKDMKITSNFLDY